MQGRRELNKLALGYEDDFRCCLKEDYEQLKEEYRSNGCCFSVIGDRPVYQFVYGISLFRDFISSALQLLDGAGKLTSISEIIDEFDDYDDISEYDKTIVETFVEALPVQYRPFYNYDFFCRFYEHIDKFIERVFQCEHLFTFDQKAFCHTVAEELFVAIIFGEDFFVSEIFSDMCDKDLDEPLEFAVRYTPEDGEIYYDALGESIRETCIEEDYECSADYVLKNKEDYEKIKGVLPKEIIEEAEKWVNEWRYDEGWIYDYMGDADILLIFEHPEMVGDELDDVFGTGNLGFAHWFEEQFFCGGLKKEENEKTQTDKNQ